MGADHSSLNHSIQGEVEGCDRVDGFSVSWLWEFKFSESFLGFYDIEEGNYFWSRG